MKESDLINKITALEHYLDEHAEQMAYMVRAYRTLMTERDMYRRFHDEAMKALGSDGLEIRWGKHEDTE